MLIGANPPKNRGQRMGAFTWDKRGLIYAPSGAHEWDRAYATLPTMGHRGDDGLRVLRRFGRRLERAESPNGIRWRAFPDIGIPLNSPEEFGIGRPWVLRENDGYS